MGSMRLPPSVLLLVALGRAAVAQSASASSCSLPSVSTTVPAPAVASGFSAKLIATNLRKPRGLAFDSEGRLLVVEQSHGVTALTLDDQGGDCLSVQDSSVVIDDTTLNHGITFNHDFTTLYVSSPESAYAYPYDARGSPIVGSDPGNTLVANMSGSDHTTRTLLFSNFTGDTPTLVITRGSTSNIDTDTLDIASGHSQIKSFSLADISASSNFDTTGTLLGWGLRNDVGIAEHPVTGGLWSVENSVDQLHRSGVDIHANNPAEELNFLGYLNVSSVPSNAYMASSDNGPNSNQGGNFGYPQCFAAWNASEVPDFPGIQTGQQFAISGQDYEANDTFCGTRIAPRLSFEAHMAPLDIKFNAAGNEAWVSFHGSWNRDDPAGYKVSSIAFDAAAGEPVAPSNSTTGYVDIVANPDLSQCPDHCFRPAGLAFDRAGRLFFSSDSTGEIYVITRSDGGSVQDAIPSGTGVGAGGSGSGGSVPGSPTSTPVETSTAAAAVTLMAPGSDGSGRSGWAVWGVTFGAVLAAGLLI